MALRRLMLFFLGDIGRIGNKLPGEPIGTRAFGIFPQPGTRSDLASIPAELPFALSESTIQEDAKTTLIHASVHRQKA